MLRRTGDSCLVRAIVVQAWEAAHGRHRDLIVGVTGATDFRAHAWLDGDPVPLAETAADLDPSELGLSGAQVEIAGSDDRPSSDPGAGPFHELVRRSAPSYR